MEGKRTVPLAASREGQRLAALLRQKVEASEKSIRELETALGWGQGLLNRVLDYQLPLRISDLAAVLPLIGTSVHAFMFEAYGLEGRQTESGDFLDTIRGAETGTKVRAAVTRFLEDLGLAKDGEASADDDEETVRRFLALA